MTYECIILRRILANVYKIQQSAHHDDNTRALHIIGQHNGQGSYWRNTPTKQKQAQIRVEAIEQDIPHNTTTGKLRVNSQHVQH